MHKTHQKDYEIQKRVTVPKYSSNTIRMQKIYCKIFIHTKSLNQDNNPHRLYNIDTGDAGIILINLWINVLSFFRCFYLQRKNLVIKFNFRMQIFHTTAIIYMYNCICITN